MKYGSVCSGIEAATMAWHPLGWTPAFFSEIEAFPSAVLAHHYGSNMPGEPLAKNGIPNYGDFTKIGADAGPIDLLVGGTPCQSFSVAGKRLGLDDPRGNLALEYLALARRLRARWIVWENVPGVLSSHTDDEQDEEVEDAEGLESADFATFLSFVQECGYGFAYRVLDAQYIRVDDYARAVPQRRRRVFLVGYLGDWRRAAAVLLEPESMRGDSAPRREARQRATGAAFGGFASSGDGFWREGIGPLRAREQDSHENLAVAFGGGNTSGSIDVSTALTALTAHGQRQDFEVETFIAEIASTLPAGGNSTGGERQPGMGAETAATMLVAHALRGEGFDASEDGTGRGTPIVPVSVAIRGREDGGTIEMGDDVAHALRASQGGGDKPHVLAPIAFNPKLGSEPTYGLGVNTDGTSYTLDANGHSTAIAFDTTKITSKTNRSQPQMGAPCHPLSAGAHAPAIAIQAGALRENEHSGPDGVGVQSGVSYTLEARAEVQAVAFGIDSDCLDRSGEGAGGSAGERSGLGITEGHINALRAKRPNAVATEWAVRRLMPIECERLQGFPDNFTNVPWRGKDHAPDGSRYKALGNSMACNAMRWIGQRIDIMEKLIKAGRIAE